VTIYHSGDTVIYAGLAERLAQYPLDIAFLPINGSDERRHALHVPPNMTLHEALDLAGQVGKPLVIPHHYDMFTFNTADVGTFEQVAQEIGQPYHVMQCGEKFVFNRVIG
jgi:L-ascorbate metabolism protein UlaG (beta-lactamase superfamily)